MSPKNRTNRNELSSGFNDENRQQLAEINITIKKLVEEVEYLKEEVEESKLKYEEIKTENEKLKQIVNTVNFRYKRFRYKGFSLIRDYAKVPNDFQYKLISRL